MRSSARLLATIQRSGRYLNAYQPTGLTGIVTHPCPRPHLIWLYKNTLDKLSTLPEISAYRKSTEALTKHRLRIVEGEIPEGYQEWKDRLSKQMQASSYDREKNRIAQMLKGDGYVPRIGLEPDMREVEWDGDYGEQRQEGPATEEQRVDQAKEFGDKLRPDILELEKRIANVEDEPPLSMQQISDLEAKIGSGLIEETIGVAEREAELVDVMKESQVWEELEEKPAEGQWTYFERNENIGLTQSP